jgi:hypothetical protein
VDYIEDVGALMLRIGFLDDLAHLGTPTYTSWTLDVELVNLGVVDIGSCAIDRA